MPDKLLSDREKDILKVAKMGIDEAKALPSLKNDIAALDENIAETESLLRSLGYNDLPDNSKKSKVHQEKKIIIVRSFDDLLNEANKKYPGDISFLNIFTPEELAANHEHIRKLNEEFNAIHRLDAVDITMPAVAGILSGAIDCAFGGFIRLENGKSIPGPFSQYVEKLFDKALPPEKIKELEKLAKVTYDAANNKNTTIDVDGLSSYFHRLVSLGHDPILGFIFGVLDLLRGTMTTLDFKGKFIIQAMDVYSDRKAQNLFEAISKVFLHMLSDVNTPQGLPVPFMALFNKLQFGSIGKDELNISEMVKSMYGQGYDFRHFCAMSVPVMITEVIVRVSYFVKRLREGYSFKDSIPVGTNHEKKPKLGTMLFIAHSAATAINAGKVVLTENPLNINYPQWLSFGKYAIKQLKWGLLDKPQLRDKYVMGLINDEWDILYDDIAILLKDITENATVVYNYENCGNEPDKSEKFWYCRWLDMRALDSTKAEWVPFKENGKCGYAHFETKEIIIDPMWDAALPFSMGLQCAIVINGIPIEDILTGFNGTPSPIDDTCNHIPESIKENCNFKSGLINQKGEIVLPVIYESIDDFDNDTAIVKLNGKYGVLGLNCEWGIHGLQGKTVLPIEYDFIEEYGGYFFAQKSGKWGFYEQTGEVIIDMILTACPDPNVPGLYLLLQIDQRYGIYGFKEKTIIQQPITSKEAALSMINELANKYTE